VDNSLFSNPEIQNLLAALIAGLLLGIASSVTKRLFLVACVIGACWILFEVVIAGVRFTPADIQYFRDIIVAWKLELVSILFGIVIGYSLVERTRLNV